MINIIININSFEKLIKYKINGSWSIYNLKCRILKKYKNKDINNIDDIKIYYNGVEMNDKRSLNSYNICNNDCLYISFNKLTGGSKKLKYLSIFGYIILVLLYIILLVSGFIPLLCYIYSDLLVYSIKYIINILGLNYIPLLDKFVSLIGFIIRYLAVIIVLYYLTILVVLPRTYLKNYNYCGSYEVSKKIAYTITLIYGITYYIGNIPNIIEKLIIDITSYGTGDPTKGPLLLTTWLDPILTTVIEPLDEAKFAPFFAIPIVGTPLMEGYHGIIDVFIAALYYAFDQTQDFSCDNPKEVSALAEVLKNWKLIPPLKEIVLTHDLQPIIEVAITGFDKNISNNLKLEIDKMPWYKKYNLFVNDVYKYYSGKYFKNMICFLFDALHATDNELNNVGNEEDVANMIKVGNVSGSLSTIAFIVIIILTFFMNKMYGINY